MIPDDGKQIPKTALYLLDSACKLGQPCRKLRKPLRFKCRVVCNDAAFFTQHVAEGCDELASGITPVRGKELVVLGLSSQEIDSLGRDGKQRGYNARQERPSIQFAGECG